MNPRSRKPRRSLIDDELRFSVQERNADECLIQIVETVSLKDIPLEDRRKEANKPLFLTRYE